MSDPHVADVFEMSLAAMLRRVRAERGDSQAAAADAIGTVQQSIARWERGRLPDARFRRRLSEYLDLDLHQLDQMIDLSAGRTHAEAPKRAMSDFEKTQLEVVAAFLESRSHPGSPVTEHESRLLENFMKAAGLID